MSPGAISQLSESDEPAFRVRFTGPGPSSGDLYWRGPVLHDFDGYTWRRDETPLRRVPLDHLGPAYAYRITLEPHRQRWWFALDTPIGAPRPDVEFTADYQLVGLRDVTQPVTYDARSTLQTRSREPLDAPARRQALRLPRGRNPRAVALGAQLRGRAPDDAHFVGDVMELFRRDGFVYSLTPPRLDLNSVDDFLFNTRTGFCGHYASAFVTLMRAGGVPARVVTGYQGGEWNPIGGYLIVRQSDAHAWAEVWIEQRGGWSRVDPTGVVAPDRLTRGFLGGLGDVATRSGGATRELGWITRGVLAWDTLNTWWKDRVIEFDLRKQLALLARLGFDDPGIDALRAMLLAGLVSWLGWIGLQLGRSRPAPPADALATAYRRLCARLARAGLPSRPEHFGPLAYADLVTAARPELAARVRPLLHRYAALRFGPGSADGPAIDAFRRDVAALGRLDRGG
jgi:transglutaminase-like putative cysteine protease